MKEHIVDLDQSPTARWEFLADYRTEMNALFKCYLNDFSGEEEIYRNVEYYKREVIPREYLEEIEFLSSLTAYSANEVLIANLYYDILKLFFGCTAFACTSEHGILHARNLDWHTDNNLLNRHSQIFDFRKGGQTLFKSVGWPGFVGVLSGMKPHQFSLTLNAVLSPDPVEVAIPISFFLREVLSKADSYESAKEMLEKTTIASDCLLLLSGTKNDEMVVIERTPGRYATRTPENGQLVVTNEYKKLENIKLAQNVLQQTACGRFDRANELLALKKPVNEKECLDILQDENVMMGITAQQMVFHNASGTIVLIQP
jgi:acid ceramidase/N-acylethanolamine-hydrolysing acid amidase